MLSSKPKKRITTNNNNVRTPNVKPSNVRASSSRPTSHSCQTSQTWKKINTKQSCKENSSILANGLTCLDSQIKLALNTLKNTQRSFFDEQERSTLIRKALEQKYALNRSKSHSNIALQRSTESIKTTDRMSLLHPSAIKSIKKA